MYYICLLYLAGASAGGEVSVESVLMEHPLCLLPARRAALVEDERLLHSQERAGGGADHLPVLAGGLPVARAGGTVGAQARGVLAVAQAEEVPLPLPHPGGVGQLPRLAPVEVHLGDVDAAARAVEHLGGEIEGDELLVGGVEPEPRRQALLAGSRGHLLPEDVPQRGTHGLMVHHSHSDLAGRQGSGEEGWTCPR
jgi:hypothetical protein